MKVLRRIDHILCETPDIRSDYASCMEKGLEEAWPIGPFWPNALTCGIRLGPFNLEFVQNLLAPARKRKLTKIAFEPTDLALTSLTMNREGVYHRFQEKVESDPKLLGLRGWSADEVKVPQKLCTTLIPFEEPVFPFFCCEYVPFQRARLAPRVSARGQEVADIEVRVSEPLAASKLLDALGLESGPGIQFAQGDESEILANSLLIGTGLSF